MIRALLFAALLIASAARADTGIAVYALASLSERDCTQTLQVFNGVKRPALSVLWGTFGKNVLCLRRYLEHVKERPHTLAIHITNETCRRGLRICEPGREISPHLRWFQYNRAIEKKHRNVLAPLRARIRTVLRFVDRYRNVNTNVLLSMGLEDTFSERAAAVVLAELRSQTAGKNILIIRNPMGEHENDFTIRGDLFELHSLQSIFERPQACVYSNDGIDVAFGSRRRTLAGGISAPGLRSTLKRYQDCEFRFVWWNTQGIERGFIRPSDRRYRIYPKDIFAVNKLIKESEHD